MVSTIAMALAVQSLTSMAMLVPTVLAPVAAAELGLEASRIGILVAYTYFVAIVSGLVCDTLIARYGPVRVFEFTVVLVAVGLASGFGGNVAVVFVLGALAGAAHGLVNPASSTILLQASPPQYRSLIFSIKQTGVPLGSAIASVLIPALLQTMHWRQAVLVLGIASALALILVAPFRSTYDRDRNPRQRIRLSGIAAPIAEVVSRPELLRLALSSAVYSAVQMSLFSYLMLYLIVELGYTLVLAGLVFSVAQVMGIISRPAWGVVADRLQAPRQLLAGLGIVMGLCGLAAALFTPDSPVAAIVVLCAVYGASAVGWNGVYLAEVARIAPPGKVGVVTGGVMLFTFSGAVLGPPAFGAILGLTGSYALGFLFIALLPLIMGLRLAFPARAAGGEN
jgi:MFS family permease